MGFCAGAASSPIKARAHSGGNNPLAPKATLHRWRPRSTTPTTPPHTQVLLDAWTPPPSGAKHAHAAICDDKVWRAPPAPSQTWRASYVCAFRQHGAAVIDDVDPEGAMIIINH